ncbi:hypothetical protein Acor_82020 [Acrocarpospora corrugata]|uniref:Secreted protein n=1 Tax=Acrocarpospora corrugata TaxID=35763 RepID=A0A5M3WG43_9ACTN|nr:hypothetical protein [Acrocarpospora corrugata]GES06133.1 hypothetical protein Acor_82020 [Acrocarpospora corrugata]
MPRTFMKGFTRTARLLTALAMSVAVPAGLAPAPAAAAAGECIFCSTTVNQSAYGITAYKSWRVSCGGTTGNSGTDCVDAPALYVGPGGHTPWDQDWDSFRVDAGWCFRVRFSIPYKNWTERYDRRGQGSTFVKVENHAYAFVEAQSTSSCP